MDLVLCGVPSGRAMSRRRIPAGDRQPRPSSAFTGSSGKVSMPSVSTIIDFLRTGGAAGCGVASSTAPRIAPPAIFVHPLGVKAGGAKIAVSAARLGPASSIAWSVEGLVENPMIAQRSWASARSI